MSANPPPSQPPRVPSPSERGGALPRRATGDPRRFLIPGDELPRGFAERLDAHDGPPAPPRPAATVVLLRPCAADDPARRGQPEALLLRRHGRSGFAANAWVFPGGTVDPADRDPALAALCDGPPPGEWARRLELDDPADASGYAAAALREAFEETGILFARPRGVGDRYRDALLAGGTSLRGIAETNKLRYSLGEWIYVAHWITPEPEPRRYDTRFFLAPVPPGWECVPHEAELVEARWLAPADAVGQFAAGELTMLPPTVDTLRRLAPFRSLPELLDTLREAPVPAILPIMRRVAGGVEIEIAGSG